MKGVVRVLVLDPSAPRRLRLQRLLENDALLQVVGHAVGAEQAIELVATRQPHVILAGQGASRVETVASTRRIMETRATPIVVVTAATTPVEERQAFELVDAGALAVLRDPGPASAGHHADSLRALLQTVRLMAEVKVVRRWPGRQAAPATPPSAPAPRAAGARRTPAAAPPSLLAHARRTPIELVAIGASTGGPLVLKQLLCALPASFPAPILVVQHMAAGFLHAMTDWLSTGCAVRTQVATASTYLQPGCVYLAPDDLHMRLAPGARLVFDAGPPVHGHRPSVAALFESVAKHCGAHALGILLTGMGKDGGAELKLLRDAGAVTIAQDGASSAVHGMPGEAIRCGAATYVMSPDEIAAALQALAAPGKEKP